MFKIVSPTVYFKHLNVFSLSKIKSQQKCQYFKNDPLHSINLFSSKNQNQLLVFQLINSKAALWRVQYEVQWEYVLHKPLNLLAANRCKGLPAT